ncbi:MAG: hypothetical protein WCA51_03020 [Dehalococcoidia bacterium]
MKFLSAILIIIGSFGVVGLIIAVIGSLTSGEIITKAIGNSIGATVFLIPGIFLYRKAAKKKTIDDKTKLKQLVCPNGCNVVQQGTNYCGRCGTRLIWR